MPDNAIAAGVNVDPLKTYSNLLGIRQQQQALTSGQIGISQQQQTLATGGFQQQTAQAESEQATQKNRELQSVGNLLKTAHTSGRYMKDDGTFNRQLFSDDVAQVAPTYGQEISGKAASIANEMTLNRATLSNLSQSFQKQQGAGFAALANKDDLSHSDVIDELTRQTGINKDPAFTRMAISMAASLPRDATPAQLKQTMQQWAIAATSPEAAAATTLPKQATNAAGQLLNVKQTTGAISSPPQAGAAPAAGGAQNTGSGLGLNPPNTAVKSVGDNTAIANEGIQSARSLGDQVPLNQHINDQLLALSKDTSTGYGTPAWHKLIGTISGGRFTGDYQTIGAYLDRQAAMNATTMGLPNTNAGLATAAGAGGTTEYSPQALQTKVKLADSLNTAAGQFRRGLDAAVGHGPNPDPAKYQAFRAAWAENFDPRIFAIENSERRGDKEETARLVSSATPAQRAALAKQRVNLNALASTGTLPQ